MKRLIVSKKIILLLIVILLGCSGDDSSTNVNDGDQQDQPPLPPSSLTGYALSDSSVYLNWLNNSADVTGFTIHRCQADSFSLINTVPGSQRYYVDYSLDEATTYSYYVMAVNNEGSSGPSDTLIVTTLSSNSPPNPPDNPFPANNAVNQPTTIGLSWDCSDLDDGDTLTYNLFFGAATDSLPPLLAGDLAEPTYNVDQLSNATIYDWRIIAYDNHGDSAIGPTWSFTTEEIP